MELVKDPNLGVGACLDLGHSFRSGNDVAKEIRKYHKWIYDIHIKDETAPSKAGHTWEMGRGQMDFVTIVKALKKVNYQGVVSIEMEKNSDKNPTASVAESLGYLRGVCDAEDGSFLYYFHEENNFHSGSYCAAATLQQCRCPQKVTEAVG